MLTDDDSQYLREVTARKTVEDAVAWISEGRSLRGESSRRLLGVLNSAVQMDLSGAEQAYRRIVRELLASDLDTSAKIQAEDDVITPEECDAVLSCLVEHSGGSLSKVRSGALRAAVDMHPHAIEVYLQVAGLTWREARERADTRLPGSPDGRWTATQLSAVTRLVSASLSGEGQRPIESVSATASAWDVADKAQATGVSYGTLLAQRIAGGVWLAHRTRTAGFVRRSIAARVTADFETEGLLYWASVGERGDTVSVPYLSEQVAKNDSDVGQLAFVTRTKEYNPTAAVLLAVAHDGGTARKTAATLLAAPGALKVPAYLLLAGKGWAARNESGALFDTYEGRVYTDRSTKTMARDIAENTNTEHLNG